MQVKALVADDHPLFRSAMVQALHTMVGSDLLESSSYQETEAMLREHPDVELVFLDLNMPGNDGLSGLLALRSHYPDILIIVVSAQDNPNIIAKAMSMGASGYIPKSTPLDEIAHAIQHVMDGEQWLPKALQAEVEQQHDPAQTAFAENLQKLTPHQVRVLKMMADGLLNKQIAYELNISESTVKQHSSAVLRKLGVINRTQAGVLYKQYMQNESD
ncbi:response regulator [Aestuariibacter salexigens]|uniref:response regulator n=1 Tax=Aestuariibacter salexigens TaxID=226010 RepID=UPI000414426F|nr:response regulator transcription factor [Aestuariibacter salexigens]